MKANSVYWFIAGATLWMSGLVCIVWALYLARYGYDIPPLTSSHGQIYSVESSNPDCKTEYDPTTHILTITCPGQQPVRYEIR